MTRGLVAKHGILAAGLLCACQQEVHPFVTVTVDVPPDLEGRVEELRVAVELDGARQDLTPPARTFGLRLPVGRSGTLMVRVEGLRGACLTGLGEASVAIAPEDRAELTVALQGPAPALRGASVSAPVNQTLRGVWGSGSGELWMVGDQVPMGGDPMRFSATILRGLDKNQPNLTLIPPARIPNDGNSLWGLWGSDAEDVVAAGVYGNIVRGGQNTPTWQRWVTGGLRTAVWGAGALDIWVVGEPFGGFSSTVRWDESKTWKNVPNPYPTQTLYGVWGSGPRDVWAVGVKGSILHWDGAAWQAVPSGTTWDLLGVWGSQARDVWAVGDGGTILNWDGVMWRPVPWPQGLTLRAVWGSSGNDVWIAGNAGTLLRGRRGASLTQVQTGTGKDLHGLFGACPDSVWAVGQAGTVLHFRP